MTRDVESLPYWSGPPRAAKGFPWLTHKTCAHFERLEQWPVEMRNQQKSDYANKAGGPA